MLKNYFRIAWRNLVRNKVYSFINVAGLCLGLASAMLIMLYIKDELSYDRFHAQLPNIYHVVCRYDETGAVGPANTNSNTGYFQGPKFTAGIPEFRSFCRLASNYVTIKKDSEVDPQECFNVDSSFFSIFSFPLIYGNTKTALLQPNSVVISEDLAKKQFGTTNVLGKTITLKVEDAFAPWVITGVAKRGPQNSTIKFDLLLPFNEPRSEETNNENWFNTFLNTFVVIAPGSNIKVVEGKMKKLYEEDAKETIIQMREKYNVKSTNTYLLQSMAEMHLSKDFAPTNGLADASNPTYSYILSGIALFILLIACINFINLTVARSLKRAKEIGIRKVVGGERRQLIFQFLGESFVLCFFAFLFAIFLVQLVLPVFNELSNKSLALHYLFDLKLVIGYIVLFLLTVLLAGFYPALVLSNYNPVQTLYNRFNVQGKNYLQKSLVVLQFALASFLIISTITIFYQFDYLTHAKLGYDDSNLVLVNKSGLKEKEAELMRQELLKSPSIIQMAGKNPGYNGTVAKVNGDSMMQFAIETVDEFYLPLLKIPITMGRNFSKNFPGDSSSSVLVNESFANKAGWKDPIGKELNFWYNNNKKYTVIGLVKNHHY